MRQLTKALVLLMTILTVALPSHAKKRRGNTAYIQLRNDEFNAANAEAARQRAYIADIPRLVKEQTGYASGSCAIRIDYAAGIGFTGGQGESVIISDAPISACDCALLNQQLSGPLDSAGFTTALRTQQVTGPYELLQPGSLKYALRDEATIQYLDILRAIYVAGVVPRHNFGDTRIVVSKAVSLSTGFQQNYYSGVLYPFIQAMCGAL